MTQNSRPSGRRSLLAAISTTPPALPRRYIVSVLAALALLGVPAVVSAANGFTEQVASARWSIQFQCPDRSTAADGRLIVETDNFIEAGTTPDPNPPLRVGFVGQCPDGTYSWGFTRPAPTQFDPNLKSVSVSGTFADVRDNRGAAHGFGERKLDRDRTDYDHGQRAWLEAPGARGDRDGDDRLRRQHVRRRRRELPVPRAVHPHRYREVAPLRQLVRSTRGGRDRRDRPPRRPPGR